VIILDIKQAAFIGIDELKLVCIASLISNIDDLYVCVCLCVCLCVITWSALRWSLSYTSFFPPHAWIIKTSLQNELAVSPLNPAVSFSCDVTLKNSFIAFDHITNDKQEISP